MYLLIILTAESYFKVYIAFFSKHTVSTQYDWTPAVAPNILRDNKLIGSARFHKIWADTPAAALGFKTVTPYDSNIDTFYPQRNQFRLVGESQRACHNL